jgi:acyl dehydratase
VNWNAPFGGLEAGQSFVTPTREVDEADVARFAELTGDHHPQHIDAEWAASSAFGERIAHGMLVVSLAVGLVPFDPERVVALRRVADVVFKRPVRLGDTIHVEGRIAELRRLTPDTGLVSWAWKVVADGRAACRANVEVVWR